MSKETLALRERLETLGLLDPKGSKAILARPVPKVLLALLGHKAPKVIKAIQGHKGPQDHKALLVLMDKTAPAS